MEPEYADENKGKKRQRMGGYLVLTASAVALAVVLAGLHRADFEAAPLPAPAVDGGWRRRSEVAEEEHGSVLAQSERVGEGMAGPEDLAYHAEEGALYAGCSDGWIRRFRLSGKVEDFVHVGGRPLGLAFAPDGTLIVAESYRGLLKVSREGEVSLLTDEAEGIKFSLTDGVDVASNGIIYFTDASYKYNLDKYLIDFLEGRPNGRLLSFDPSTNQTTVLVRDLYFANGVSLSPDQQSLIFCETTLRRCRRYHIEGEKKGTVEEFIQNLPGFPDNIRYVGDSHYWIGLPMGRTLFWDLILKYPFIRKLKAVLGMKVNYPPLNNSGVMKVNLEGKLVALYKDTNLAYVTGGFTIGKHLYLGSLVQNYLLKIDITKLAPKA